MPHSTGLAIDIGVNNISTHNPVYFYDYNSDGELAYSVNFYKYKQDKKSKEFQRLQDLIINTFITCRFKLGLKKEVWHFELDI
jgi:hypothetical protein